jgi:hypothetical protein
VPFVNIGSRFLAQYGARMERIQYLCIGFRDPIGKYARNFGDFGAMCRFFRNGIAPATPQGRQMCVTGENR